MRYTGSRETLKECSNQPIFDPYQHYASFRSAHRAKGQYFPASVPHHIYIMGYYPALERNELSSHEKNIGET